MKDTIKNSRGLRLLVVTAMLVVSAGLYAVTDVLTSDAVRQLLLDPPTEVQQNDKAPTEQDTGDLQSPCVYPPPTRDVFCIQRPNAPSIFRVRIA